MLKKIIVFLLTVCIMCSVGITAFNVSAAQIHEGKITIDTISAVTGDTIIIPIRMENNPGIMAMTISITYNAEALTYERYYFGDVVNDYYVVDHPTKNLLRFVNCEKKDKARNGTILSLQFKVKDNAEADFHKISIDYSAGDFCNWNLDKIMPEIVSGGVEVAFNGNNCKHKKYGDWTTVAVATCKQSGAKQRICKVCGHTDIRQTDPVGHTYSDSWTIDEPATPEKDGLMSRYCLHCDHYVDRMTFSYENVGEGNIDNSESADVPINDYTEGIFKEQFPDKELTSNSSSPSGTTSDTNSGTSSATQSGNTNSGQTDNNTSSEDNTDSSSTQTDITENPITALDKLTEAFPKFEKIVEYFKVAALILLILILI